MLNNMKKQQWGRAKTEVMLLFKVLQFLPKKRSQLTLFQNAAWMYVIIVIISTVCMILSNIKNQGEKSVFGSGRNFNADDYKTGSLYVTFQTPVQETSDHA